MAIPRTGKKTEKSVKLTTEELDLLVELREQSNSDTAFASTIGIDRVTLIRIMTIGSGSENNVKKIRRKISKLKEAA